MKTNIGIETSDIERRMIGDAIGLPGMVSRKQLKEEIERHVATLIFGPGQTADSKTEPALTSAPISKPAAERNRSVREFVPSRGDEPYLYSGENPELTDACRGVLDGLEFIEKFTWAALNKDRK